MSLHSGWRRIIGVYVYVAGRRAGLVMSYNLVSPHYTTTKAKSGGRKKVKEEEGDMTRRGSRSWRMGKIRGGKPMGCDKRRMEWVSL